MTNVIPFNRPRVVSSPDRSPTTLKAYALADLIVAAQVALHVHKDSKAHALLCNLVNSNRTSLTLQIPVTAEVSRYLPDDPASLPSRKALYGMIYRR
jgi:hypothetical protein